MGTRRYRKSRWQLRRETHEWNGTVHRSTAARESEEDSLCVILMYARRNEQIAWDPFRFTIH